jgi:hypothetical protein
MMNVAEHSARAKGRSAFMPQGKQQGAGPASHRKGSQQQQAAGTSRGQQGQSNTRGSSGGSGGSSKSRSGGRSQSR